ncbi:MAG: DNA topoisomerase III [Paludibacter sp.]|nr:DNA topoisomerase III [Paludibacter sp.]
MKIAILAEKPSVGREIARIVGATEKKDGYIQGNGYQITWAFGHLVGLAMPSAYGINNFNQEQLPVLPQPFLLTVRQVKVDKAFKPDTGAMKQLKIINKVFDECDKIIVATDAGREGELIFRYIYSYLGCTKPFDRLWISSLTDKAIQEGLQKLRLGKEYDLLYTAAKARSEADWLVGINASQALSIAVGTGTFSLGRVQTPTLAMICSRFLENKHFVSEKYWQLRLYTENNNIAFIAFTQEKFDSMKQARDTFERLKDLNSVRVHSVESKTANQHPPLLFDLTNLQKDANSRYGFSADKTLSIAQKLYETKLITYPRTGSRYISDDVFETIPELLGKLKFHPHFGIYANLLNTLNKQCVDGKKVTDHHALLITENNPKKLSEEEQVIYDMIVGRMLEAFSEKCIKEVTTLVLDCDEVKFEEKGAVTMQAGWRAVYNEKEDADENNILPIVSADETLPLKGIELLENHTRPKPLHTESTLLAAMENAGKELENEEERLAMKEAGIGTPATRASIIETLFIRDYIRRDKKSLVPTDKGMFVYNTVKEKQIADVGMTGMWENMLSKIEKDEMTVEIFNKAITVHTIQITKELLNSAVSIAEKPQCSCPDCKSGRMIFYDKLVKCSNPECSVAVFRTKSEKKLTDKQIVALLTTGKTEIIKGFRSKNGKSFDASLALDNQFHVVFEFDKQKSVVAE